MKPRTILAILAIICGLVIISGCTSNTGNNTTTNQTNATG